MFTKVGCDQEEQPSRHSPAHQSMTIVKVVTPKDACQEPILNRLNYRYIHRN